MTTKGDIAREALEEIGIASYEYDITSDQIERVIQKLDLLISYWSGIDILVPYLLPTTFGESQDDLVIDMPDSVRQAMVYNLALQIAPMYNKKPNTSTVKTARNSYETIVKASNVIITRAKDQKLPVGAGNKSHMTKGEEFVKDVREVYRGK